MSAGHTDDATLRAAANAVPLPWGLMGTIKDFGVVVVLIWYLWHTQTNSIPSTQKDFHDLLIKEREVFRAELVAQRNHDEKRNDAMTKVLVDITLELRRLKAGSE